MEMMNIDKQERKYILNECKWNIQNANSDSIDIELIPKLLKKIGIKRKKENIIASAMRLTDNVMPHDDADYCDSLGLRWCYLVVLNTSVKDKYKDSPPNNYFYTNGVFHNLLPNSFIKFDPKKLHSAMISKSADVLVIFN